MGQSCCIFRVYLKELLSLSGDVGGKKVMKQHLQDTFFGEAASRQELEDMDYAPESKMCEHTDVWKSSREILFFWQPLQCSWDFAGQR